MAGCLVPAALDLNGGHHVSGPTLAAAPLEDTPGARTPHRSGTWRISVSRAMLAAVEVPALHWGGPRARSRHEVLGDILVGMGGPMELVRPVGFSPLAGGTGTPAASGAVGVAAEDAS